MTHVSITECIEDNGVTNSPPLESRPKWGGFGKSAESAGQAVHAGAVQRELAGFSFIHAAAKPYVTTRPAPALAVR